VAATITFGGLVHAEGFGAHTFSASGTGVNQLTVQNSGAGTGNYTQVVVANNVAELGFFSAFSSTYTTVGYNKASGVRLASTGVGGLSLVATDAAGTVGFYTGASTTERVRVETTGALLISDGTAATADITGASRLGLAFLNDADCGIWRENTDQWTIVSGGAIAMRFTTSGNNVSIDLGASKFSTAPMPSVDDSLDLGRSDQRWDDVYATNGTIQTSDRALKQDITPSPFGLGFLRALQPVQYRWANPDRKGRHRWHLGLIAQDVLAGAPDISAYGLVTGQGTQDDPYGMRYQELIAPLIMAVQELAARLDALEAR
jgi:Chaperone of endosialidase